MSDLFSNINPHKKKKLLPVIPLKIDSNIWILRLFITNYNTYEMVK